MVYSSRSYYTWGDQEYRDFMVSICKALNPRFERAGEILYQEFESYCEVLFVLKGDVALGFEVNKKKYFMYKYPNHSVIGSYNVTFNQEGAIMYKALTDI